MLFDSVTAQGQCRPCVLRQELTSTTDMESDGWHTHIKWALERRGSSLSQIARELSVNPSTVTRVARGSMRSRRIEEAIAAATSFTPAQLWPANYPEQEGGKQSADSNGVYNSRKFNPP